MMLRRWLHWARVCWALGKAIAYLPVQLREVVAGMDVVCVPWFRDEDYERGASSEMGGYYYAEEDNADGACMDHLSAPQLEGMRPQIVIIAANLQPDVNAVATVLLHELGHHLGFDEWELTEGLGLR